MSQHKPEDKPKPAGTLASYSIGFALSVALTLGAFSLASGNLLHGWSLTLTIMGLAIVQLVIQLVLFLHLGHEGRPRWKLNAFLFMLLILIVVVAGSLWIMYNLNYHMMPDTEHINQYLRSQDDT